MKCECWVAAAGAANVPHAHPHARHRVECVGGCECEAATIDALWQEKASMLMTAEFQVGAWSGTLL